MSSITVVDQWPYALATAGPSTVGALAKVYYSDQHDLAGQRVYDPLALRRVWVHRRACEAGRSPSLVVLPVLDGERQVDPRELAGRTPLGRLVPAQRYLLRAGIVRARTLSELLADQLADPWGCAIVTSAGAAITLTPPILERLHPLDRSVHERTPDFIVCDGNHRIVERAWRRGRPVAAVASLDSPAEPFYILPTREGDWAAVSGNEVQQCPPREQKYTVRAVPTPAPGTVLAAVPAAERYRRYFRLLETGFGHLGGQGGL
ncbi:MAG: hypothetical protein ACR2N4_18475 [Jatrophihabitans sp.]